MLFAEIGRSDGSAIALAVIVSLVVGALGMLLYQRAVSWRLRRFLKKNCAACMTPDTDALVMHSHPISAANR